VREQAALAHAQRGREAPDRQALQSFHGGEVGGRLQDRLAGRVAAPPPPVGLFAGDRGRGGGKRLEVLGIHRSDESSTIVRYLIQSTTDRAFLFDKGLTR
jgi:hypothetical protein